MGHEEERPVEPFSDIHVEGNHVRATLLHDPTVEGLEMALYLDGSKSMDDEYEYKAKPRGLWSWLTGKPAPEPENQVDREVRWMLQYLATKDRNGKLRVAYWACGEHGTQVEAIGELQGASVDEYSFPGPKSPGHHTMLAPAIHDFLAYLKRQEAKGAKRGCAVIITDGQVHDSIAVKKLSEKITKDMAAKAILPVSFVLVGVGDGIDEEQLEDICHEEYPGIGHMWCHRIAKEIKQVAELVAVLVDETMTVAAGGTIYDDKGKVLKEYEGRLPAVLEFKVPEGCKHFTLEVSGQRFTQPIPDEDHHGDEDEDEDHH
jgi:hypothetical protein